MAVFETASPRIRRAARSAPGSRRPRQEVGVTALRAELLCPERSLLHARLMRAIVYLRSLPARRGSKNRTTARRRGGLAQPRRRAAPPTTTSELGPAAISFSLRTRPRNSAKPSARQHSTANRPSMTEKGSRRNTTSSAGRSAQDNDSDVGFSAAHRVGRREAARFAASRLCRKRYGVGVAAGVAGIGVGGAARIATGVAAPGASA